MLIGIAGEEEYQTSSEDIPAKKPEARYVAEIKALMNDAVNRGEVQGLVDRLAWALAEFAYLGGPLVAGDIVKRLGAHMGTVAERYQAQAEAEQARREGRPSH